MSSRSISNLFSSGGDYAEQISRMEREQLAKIGEEVAVESPEACEPEDSIAPVPGVLERLEALELGEAKILKLLDSKASKADLDKLGAMAASSITALHAYVQGLESKVPKDLDAVVGKAQAAAADAQMAADKAHGYSKKIEDVYAMKVATDLYHASAPSPSAPPALPVSYAVGEPMMPAKKPSKKQVVLKRFFGVKAAA